MRYIIGLYFRTSFDYFLLFLYDFNIRKVIWRYLRSGHLQFYLISWHYLRHLSSTLQERLLKERCVKVILVESWPCDSTEEITLVNCIWCIGVYLLDIPVRGRAQNGCWYLFFINRRLAYELWLLHIKFIISSKLLKIIN